MLFQLIDNIVSRISNLDLERDAPAMAGQIRNAFPQVFTDLKGKGARDDVMQILAIAMAKGCLQHIKTIPGIVSEMRAAIESNRVAPALGCAMCSTLAYLVQPHDLIPDDTPGGYGFIDDYILLRAGQMEFHTRIGGNQAELEEIRKTINMASSMIPMHIRPTLQQCVNGLSTAIQLFAMMPLQVQILTMRMIIANPLQATTPQAPSGFVPHPGYAVPTRGPQVVASVNTWRDGETIGVNFPGGGGVISDGRNIYPI